MARILVAGNVGRAVERGRVGQFDVANRLTNRIGHSPAMQELDWDRIELRKSVPARLFRVTSVT